MKHFVFFIFLAVFITSCKSTSPIVTSKKEKNSRSENKKTERLAEHLIDVANDNIGVKYIDGFSGFH